jgi:HNH endonuclease
MKRSPLHRRTPLRRGGPLPRVSRKGQAKNREYRKVRRWVADRSGGMCEARIEDVCEGRGCHAHHILPRSASGPDEPGNLLWVCLLCHDHIHRNPAWAYAQGLLRRRSA